MTELIRRTLILAGATLMIGVMVGCSTADTIDADAEAEKINKGLEGQPPVDESLSGMDLGGAAEGAPKGKRGAGGGP